MKLSPPELRGWGAVVAIAGGWMGLVDIIDSQVVDECWLGRRYLHETGFNFISLAAK